MAEKFEFCSEAWLRLAGTTLKNVVEETRDSIAGQHLSVCERFANPPEHLTNGPHEVAWSFSIGTDGSTKIASGILADADFTSFGDYQTVLPGVRTVFEKSPAFVEARNKARREAVAAGRSKQEGSLDHASLAMRLVLIEFHNRLAVRTA